MVNTPVCALDAAAELGEGAVWCDRDHVLWWVDINAPALHRFDPATSQDQSWPMPEPIGCLALGPDRRVVVALASGLAWFDPDSGALDRFLPIEADQPDTRLNDGRCDRQGGSGSARWSVARAKNVACCTAATPPKPCLC